MSDLVQTAKVKGIKYFLISYVDLFGTMRAKLVPAAAIGDMAKSGAGFAGFASWLDMTPADPDVLAVPDPDSLIQIPWRKEVGWLAADPHQSRWFDHLRRRRSSVETLLRPAGTDAPLRRH